MDEKKKYSVEGTVTISTEEYRDLLTDKFEMEKDRDSYQSRYWNEQSKTRDLEKKVEELQAQYDKVSEFVKADNERYQSYVQFVAGKSVEI